MKIGVLAENANPRTDRPTEFVSKNAAAAFCRRATHVRISPRLIQKLVLRKFSEVKGAHAFFDGYLGTGNVLPFSRVQSKLRAPDSINYPIPAIGAHGRLLRVAQVNYVPA